MLIFGMVAMVGLACVVDMFSKIRFLGHSLCKLFSLSAQENFYTVLVLTLFILQRL